MWVVVGVVKPIRHIEFMNLGKIVVTTWIPCFSHIKRKFFKAEAIDPEFRKWVFKKDPLPFHAGKSCLGKIT